MLVAITVVTVTILFSFRPSLPNSPISFQLFASESGDQPAWGDGSDCKNVNGVQTCLTLPTIVIDFLNPPAVQTSQVLMVFDCNGSVYLSATLADMAWVPGSTSTVGGTGPQLSHCGTYTPPKAAWNRFAFFDQLDPGSTVLHPGDTLVVYAHTFSSFVDDDFHGAPVWCYTVQGACSVNFYYLGFPQGLAATLSLFGLYTP